MKHERINPDKVTCDVQGCNRDAVAGNGVGGRLCSYHI
jgi:hypothetical protein